MSYLLQYARRPDSITPRTPVAHVDEYARLNRPGLYGDAYVRVFVEAPRRGGVAAAPIHSSCCRSPTARTRSTSSSRSRRHSYAKTRSSR